MARPYSSSCIDLLAPPLGPISCLYSCFCFSCAAGDVAKAAGNNWCASCCCSFAATFGIGACILCADRVAMQKSYGIQEEPALTAFLLTCCCPCCSIRQQLNEAAHVAVSKGGAASSVMLQFPDQQVMMAAPAAVITALKTALDAVSK